MVTLKTRKLTRLRESVDWSIKKLRPFRQNRMNALKAYVGRNYSNDGSQVRMPVNVLELALTIYQRQLASHSPKALVTTAFEELKPSAAELEVALNHLIEEMKFGNTLRLAVIESLIGMGIVKVGIEVKDHANELGTSHDTGQPFADIVHMDDWCHDMTAKRYDQIGYAGNKYRIPYDYVMQSQHYNATAKRLLKPTEKINFGRDGGDMNSNSISSGSETVIDEYEDHVELWDLWLPRENLIVTLPVDGDGPPLHEQEWMGPENGPYHILGFEQVPGNVMPLPPASQWYDLNDLLNRMWRKLGNQAERQKTVLGVAAHAMEDGKRIIDVDDGQGLFVENPDGAREYRFGGVDQQTLGFAMTVKDTASYMMGNIDAIAGLAPQSSTVGQDRLLNQAANERIDDMQQSVANFTTAVLKDVAMYLWTDPLIKLPLVKRVEGTDIEIPFNYTPESREGDFIQYNMDIEPYSMRVSSPSEKLQMLNDLMMNIFIPASQMLEAQGVTVDMAQYVATIAKYGNLKELEDILIHSKSEDGRGPVDPYSTQPRNTTRRYENVNHSAGPTGQGQQNMMHQALMGGGGNMPQTGPQQPAGVV
jgi:hypothetical protein